MPPGNMDGWKSSTLPYSFLVIFPLERKKISIEIRKHKEKNVSMLYNLMPEIDISEATTLIDFNFQKSVR